MKFKCRASSASKLMTNARKKGELSETAKSVVRDQALKDVYGYQKKLDVKQINKGLLLEDTAIQAVSLLEFATMTKNTERRENGWVTGECDILTSHAIRDTKCSWSVDSFPFTQDDAEKQVKKSGYDWQGQVYMWLWDKEVHYVDFVLLPTPFELLGRNDDPYQHIDLVEKIPLQKRIKSVKIERDKSKIDELIERVQLVQPYYLAVVAEIKADMEQAA